MSSHEIVVSQQSSRSLDDLFGILSDHNRLTSVLGVPVKRIKDGQADINGVGSVRRLGPPILGVEETVTAVEPNKRIEYKITRNGGPIRNHAGRLDFAETDSGSSVTWTIRFDAPLPVLGQGVATVLEQGVKLGLRRLG